jgi:hypothetical protein
MKKIYLAALTLAMTACVSNDDLNPVDNYGYIDVNVSNNPVMVTRAEQDVKDLSGWTITAEKGTEIHNLNHSNIVPAGTYTVKVKSHDNETTANTTNTYGQAYYEGSVSGIVVSAGATATPTVDCKKAKNSMLTLVNNTTIDETTPQLFTDISLNASSSNRNLKLTETNPSAFYSKGTDVEYNITYKYNGGELQTLNNNGQNFTIKIDNEATNYQIILSSNTNGKISVTIKYDNTFANVESNTITFDAATGEKVTTPSQGE